MNSFEFSKVEDFDKHIRLSIPGYNLLTDVFKGLAEHFSYEESCVMDLGCSTGKFLNSLEKKKQTAYVGIDVIDITESPDFQFIQGDCAEELPDYDCSVVICMFLLQFLGKKKRKDVIDQLRIQVERGATLLVSEKIELDCTKLQTIIHRMHIREKRNNFTDKEILDKDEQLANSMYCLTESELMNELKSIGRITRVWQSYNFVGYIVR